MLLESSVQYRGSILLPRLPTRDPCRPGDEFKKKRLTSKLVLFLFLFSWFQYCEKKRLTSLMSPTSKFLLSVMVPLVSAGPNGPDGPALTDVHGEVMVPVPTTPSVKLK